MRHTFSIIAMGAALSVSLLTACSSEDSFEAQPATPTEQTNTPVAFGSYLGRSVSTRGAAYLQIKDIAQENNNIGIYAMYTKGEKFDPSNASGKYTKYEDNFMQNLLLHSSLTADELKAADDTKIAESWVYSPLRYWPMTSEEYLSFMAYAPFSTKAMLSDKDGNDGDGAGSLSYYKHEVAADPAGQIDLLYADPTGITNMQLYAADATGNGTTWTHSGDFYGLDGDQTSSTTKDKRAPLVNLKFKHATSRIGFVVTSSALKAEGNYPYTVTTTTTDETTGEETTTTENKTAKAGDEATAAVDGKMSITVNKVMLLGDNASAGSTPVGAFYPSGYLNLSTVTDGAPLWSSMATDGKLAFTYDNTSSARTVAGEYKNDGAGKINVTAAQYTWLPSDLTGDTKTASKTIKGKWETEEVTETDAGGNTTTKTQFKENPTIDFIGNGASDYMFVIPQDFETDQLYAYLDFTLNDGDGNSQEFKVYRQIKQKFEAGKAYIIVMDISSLTAIQFSVELDNWLDEILVPTDPQF